MINNCNNLVASSKWRAKIALSKGKNVPHYTTNAASLTDRQPLIQPMKLTLRTPLLLPLSAAIALLSNSTTEAASYPSLILSDNPVAYYRLEDLSGATISDATTNHFDGNITSITQLDGITVFPQFGLPGITTNSSLFKTSDNPVGNGNIDIPVNATMNPTTDGTHGAAFTAECWVQPNTQPGSYEVPLANFGRYNQPAPYNNASGWNFYQTPGPSSTWAFQMKPAPGYLGTGYAITLLQWYHLVVAFNGTNVSVYINGVPQFTVNAAGYLANDGSADLVIGQGPATGFLAFDGGIDEVALYTYALSPAQVLAHYQLGTNSFRAVPTPPSFLSQPPATPSAYSGTQVTLGVTASGTTPLSYQWKKGNTPIAGATSSTYSFVCHYPADDQASFSVVVTNAVGITNSTAATLTVLTNLNVTHDPFSITRRVGGYAAFRAVANGAVPITYQWSKSTDGGTTFTPIAGATSDTLWLSNVQLTNDQSLYSAHVAGPFGNVDTAPATLTVISRTNTVPITGYARVVTADKPVGYWRLDEAADSTIATDAVGSFDGAYLGTPLGFSYPAGVPHDTNLALHVTNTANVNIPYALELNPVTGPWSTEFWIQPTSLDANNFHTPISSEDNTGLLGTTLFGWNIYQHVAGVWTWNVYSGGGGGSFTSEFTDNPIVPGTWYHMVLTDDLTTLRWYSNGRLVLTLSRAGVGFIPNGLNGDPAVAGGPLVLGQRSDGAYGGFDGGVDEVAVYNYVLSPDQIKNHFLNTTKLTITKSGGNSVLTWGVGTLQSSTSVGGPYSNVAGATSPYTNAISGASKFYRVQVQ
ncbi:MAG: Immunoglobulin I-set domain protein [Pedosphaera sp.]|nr:Immunoglobulin I-set domain protein [Pedosphaera sp.]